MKKIFSLLLAVSMLCAMMITASADANVAMGFTPSATEVTVGDTFTVDVYVNIVNADYAVTGAVIQFATDDSIATMTALDRVGTAASAMGAPNLATKKANATLMGTTETESGVWFTATFEAKTAGEFVVAANTSQSYANYKPAAGGTAKKAKDIAPITITIKPAGPVEERIDGAAVECAKTWTAAKSAGSANTNEYTNVAVAKAECAAGAKEAGFKFVKDDVNNTAGADFVVLADANGIAGEGTVEYTAVMYGVDYSRVSTIYAIPYYVIVK